jgi:hypothetical protein
VFEREATSVNVMLNTAVVGVALLLCGCAADPNGTPPPPVTVEDERAELLGLVARGYFPGRSGQILFVPEPGEIILRRPMGFYRFMHGSPWEYDRHVPLLFHGPGFVTPGVFGERVQLQDVAPTILSLVGIPPAATMSGRALHSVFQDHEAPPRVAAVMVLDGMRADYLERFGDVMPTLARLSQEGAAFSNAWINYVPTVTSAGHTTVATGADPRIHGISGNGYYDVARGGEFTLFDGLSPRNVMALGIADLWNLHSNGDAVIITQGTTPRATVSLAGHGACGPNGRATIMAMFDYRAEGWVTNPDCYTLPEYLERVSARTFWEKAGASWRGLEIENGRVFVMTPLLPDFQADALVSMIEREAVGDDDVPDLLMVNFKSPDYVGHNFGPHAEETREVLQALDQALGRVVEAIEAAAGAEGHVIAITADHGMPSEPEGERQRRFIRDIMGKIHEQLDPGGGRLLYEFLDTANNQLYVDVGRMHELGLELSDVAAAVESLAYIKVAFTETEVRTSY